MTRDIWPDAELEKQMLRDASELPTSNDAGCHIKALLSRVRDLEKEVAETARERDGFHVLRDQYYARELKLLELLEWIRDVVRGMDYHNLADEINRKIQEAIR